MNDITMNVIGNVVNEVELRFTKAGEPVASFRVASGTRRFDRNSGRWVDGDTHYFTVSCWRGLAHNVVQSLHKGMPVMVIGRLRSREVERPCKEHNHTVRYFDIEATSVGPDLARGTEIVTLADAAHHLMLDQPLALAETIDRIAARMHAQAGPDL